MLFKIGDTDLKPEFDELSKKATELILAVVIVLPVPITPTLVVLFNTSFSTSCKLLSP